MGSLIRSEDVAKVINEVLNQDMNDALDIITKKVVSQLESTVKKNVAARLIAMAGSEYSMRYDENQLLIKVKLETNNR